MKALILGAGYGTRLERDLRADTSGQYSQLLGVPKPLLPIGDQPLASHWLTVLETMPEFDEVYVVTNSVNHAAFEAWAKNWTKVKLVCDRSISNETRIGAVAAMNLAAQHFHVQDDFLIIAGDTLFYEDFSLPELCKKYRQLNPGSSLLVYVTCTDEDVHKYGILETDESNRVTGFLEKPQHHETQSRKECPCFYLFSREHLPLLAKFLDEKKDEPLKARDATGNFVAWLYSRCPVYATEISGRFDVGGLPTYITCHQHFLERLKDKS